MAPSPKVRTYDLQPEMSAAEVTEHLVAAIRSGDYALIVVNYANPDMVGHTGILEAAIKAVEAVDAGPRPGARRRSRRWAARCIVTADHGNCEVMVDPETGGPHTAHTLNPVPVVLVGGPRGRAAPRRAALRPRADAARADGARPAARDDRAEPDRDAHDPGRRSSSRSRSPGRRRRRAAADPGDAIAAASARIAEAGTALAAAEAPPERVAALGQAVGDLRGGARGARAPRSRTPGGASEALALDLAERRIEIERLLAALEAMSRTPRPAQALHPQGPLGAARAAAMMARLTPALQERAEALGRPSSPSSRRRAGCTPRAAPASRPASRGSATRRPRSRRRWPRASPLPEVPGEPTVTMMARDSETPDRARRGARQDRRRARAAGGGRDGPAPLAGRRRGAAPLQRARRRRGAPARHRRRGAAARAGQRAGRRDRALRRAVPRVRLRRGARARRRRRWWCSPGSRSSG